MNCKNCGSKLDDGAKFCGSCGFKVESSDLVNDLNQNVSAANVALQEGEKSSNLKNFIIIFLICIFVGGLAFLGYSLLSNSKSSADKIEYALNNMLDMDEFKLSVNMDISSKYDGQDISVSAGADAIIDIKNKLASVDVNASVTGVSINVPAYIDMNEEMIYLKVPTDNNWYKMSIAETTGLDFENFKVENKKLVFEDYLRNDEFIEKVSSDIDGTDKYILHFTKDVLKKLSDDSNNDFDYSVFEENGFSDGFELSLYVNNKENYVTRMIFDFSSKTFNGVTFDKFIFSIDITDVNKIDSISIPKEALNAEVLDTSNFGTDFNTELNDDEYVEDNKLSYNGHVINYELPKGSEASSVNSSDFKIYRNNGMRVIMSIYNDNRDSFFEEVDTEKEGAIELGYTDVNLSDMKELNYDGKTFYYKELTYKTTYGTSNYEVYMCYVMDDDYVYSITFEDDDNNGSVTEDSMKKFLKFN